MAASEVEIGYGMIFAVSSDGGTNYTDLAEVFDITPPASTIDVIDVTHSQSPDRTREFITGLKDPGECSMEMNFIPGSAADTAIRAMSGVQDLRITYANGVIWNFQGLLTGYEPAAPNDDKMTATVTFKVTSTVTSVSP